jgi:hypothetical protein
LPTITGVLAGRQQVIHAERDRKLEATKQQRQSASPAGCAGAKRPATATILASLR